MRHYIRHPVDIPIEVDIDKPRDGAHHTVNVGNGGIAFFTSKQVAIGELVTIRIPPIDPVFQLQGRVVWCKHAASGYDVGVAFLDEQRAFQARMMEQICYIEHYQKEVLEREGRTLTLEEASKEWVGRYADTFAQDE
ncbi:MAG: hypothetical protein A2V90_00185 [Gammaproteobacteria bacterium RBG_16_57_12]|nr:MAG: hypothetical protein A2V90_00185 [Gammaproteobacteria bacterium RBG_16_57_12]